MSLEGGNRLGPFEIRGRLDLPGVGEVYAARDHDLQRDVAIHVLRTNAAQDENVRDQFERDVRAAAARIQSRPLTVHLIGVDRQAVYVVSEPIAPAPAAALAPGHSARHVPSPRPRVRDVRARRRALAVVAIAVFVAAGLWMLGSGDDETASSPQRAAAEPDVPEQPVSPPAPERDLESLESNNEPPDSVDSDAGAPEPPEPLVSPPPRQRQAAPPAIVPPASVAPRVVQRDEPVTAPRASTAPAAPAAPLTASVASPAAPRGLAASTDTRDAKTLLTEATVRATEFDLPGALELLELASSRGDADARIAVHYVSGLIAAREAFRVGGSGEALKPVEESMRALSEISQGRPGAAEVARLALQAAAAAAQSERDEMRLYIESATQMEALQHAAGQGGAPIVPAAELAGELWLQVHRYEDARQAYTAAADRVGSTLRVLSGLGRTARRLNDMSAACTSYRRLVDVWGGRPGLPVEIAEARAYLGGCR